MIQSWKQLSSKTVHENPWWKYKRDVYEKPNGEPGDFFYGETPGFSMVVPVLEDGRLVLIRQYRYLEDKECIGFPGGGIKSNQTPLDTAKAELLEETGCLAHEFVKIGMFQPSPGFVKDKARCRLPSFAPINVKTSLSGFKETLCLLLYQLATACLNSSKPS